MQHILDNSLLRHIHFKNACTFWWDGWKEDYAIQPAHIFLYELSVREMFLIDELFSCFCSVICAEAGTALMRTSWKFRDHFRDV